MLPNADPPRRRRTWVAAAIAGLVLLCGAQASGQEWAKKMFGGTTTHDFGVVARGAKAEYRFVVENVYNSSICPPTDVFVRVSY